MTAARPGLVVACVAILVGCAGPEAAGLREHDSASRLRVAAAAEASGQTDVALSMYAAAAAGEPDRAEVQARFAAALARSGNLAQAERVLDRAIERRPGDAALLLQLGRLRLRSGAAAQALDIFERLVAAAPRNAEALGGRGVALDLLGNHAEAEQSHRRALSLAPDSVAMANNLAMSLLLGGRPAEAAAILEPLARRPSAPPRVAANLAIAQAASGDRNGARSLAEGPGGAGAIEGILEALSGVAPAVPSRI